MSNTTNMISACCDGRPIVYIDELVQAHGPICCLCEKECTLKDGRPTEESNIPLDYTSGIQYMRKRFPITKKKYLCQIYNQ